MNCAVGIADGWGPCPSVLWAVPVGQPHVKHGHGAGVPAINPTPWMTYAGSRPTYDSFNTEGGRRVGIERQRTHNTRQTYR